MFFERKERRIIYSELLKINEHARLFFSKLRPTLHALIRTLLAYEFSEFSVNGKKYCSNSRVLEKLSKDLKTCDPARLLGPWYTINNHIPMLLKASDMTCAEQYTLLTKIHDFDVSTRLLNK